MTDFFGNLLLRSAGEFSPLAILQPRLPSLFEPSVGDTEPTMPAPDPVLRETVVPVAKQSTAIPSIDELSTGRLPATVEPAKPERTVRSIESHITPVPNQTVRHSTMQAQPEAVLSALPDVVPHLQLEVKPSVQPEAILPVQPDIQSQVSIVQTLQFISPPVEPQWTIMPRPDSRDTQKELPPIEGHRAAPRELGKFSQPEPVAVDTPTMEVFPRQIERTQESLQVAISLSPLKQNPIFDSSEGSMMEPASEKKESKPIAVLQPVPTSHHPSSIQPSIQTQSPQPQRVVEIHIGRIEVRAAPPSTPMKRGSQKATTMSLEEYLRSRPGEK